MHGLNSAGHDQLEIREGQMSAWIRYAPEDPANADLQAALELARTPHGTIDNVMKVHSLRPSTMVGHVTLYRSVLHDSANRLPAWLQETVGSYVSFLNSCDYSFANHWKNAVHLLDDEARVASIEDAFRSGNLASAFSESDVAVMEYAAKLALRPADMVQGDVQSLRDAGLDDGLILEVNQIVGYFSYVNRLLNGLGVTTEGDIVGYYPDADGPEGVSAG